MATLIKNASSDKLTSLNHTAEEYSESQDEFHDRVDILLRIQLPNNNTTVMQFSSDVSMWKILDMICTKKNLNAAEIEDMKVNYDGKEGVEVLMEKTLGFYNKKLERIMLISSNSRILNFNFRLKE